MSNINVIDMRIERSLRRINGDEYQYRDLLANDFVKTIKSVLDSLSEYDGEIKECVKQIRIDYLASNYEWDDLALEAKEELWKQLDTLADLVDKENF